MKYRYLILNEDYEIFGTNSEEDALEALKHFYVFDLEKVEQIDSSSDESYCTVQPWKS